MPGAGRPRGPQFQRSRVLQDYMAVYKAGVTGKHKSPQRQALAEFYASRPKEFLKHLQDQEAEYRKEFRQWKEERREALDKAHAARAARKAGSEKPEVLPAEPAEERAEDLMNRLLDEWEAQA